MTFGEDLAVLHAELLLNKRKAIGALPKNLLGCGARLDVRAAKYRESLAAHADYARLDVGWRELAPDEGELDFAAARRGGRRAAASRRLPVILGPLVDLTHGRVPDWLVFYEDDFDAVSRLALDFVRKVVGRYKGRIAGWEVVGHLAGPSPMDLTFEQAVELTRVLCAYAKRASGGGRILVQVREAFGGYLAGGRGAPPMLYAEMVGQGNVPCDAFSAEVRVGPASAGCETRDLFQLSNLLDRFAPLGKPLYVTAAACPGGGKHVAGGGCWRRDWDARPAGRVARGVLPGRAEQALRRERDLAGAGRRPRGAARRRAGRRPVPAQAGAQADARAPRRDAPGPPRRAARRWGGRGRECRVG